MTLHIKGVRRKLRNFQVRSHKCQDTTDDSMRLCEGISYVAGLRVKLAQPAYGGDLRHKFKESH